MSEHIISEPSNNSKKSKKDKYNGFNVPPFRKTPINIKYCLYIYNMIKEANPSLLESDDVKNAYNNFVECCSKYDRLVSITIVGSEKYHRKIQPLDDDKYNDPFKGLPLRWKYRVAARHPITMTNFEEEDEDTKKIIATYMILYELIKRDVVPYMEIKAWEKTSKEYIQYYNESIMRLEGDVKKYSGKLEKLDIQVKKYSDNLDKIRERTKKIPTDIDKQTIKHKETLEKLEENVRKINDKLEIIRVDVNKYTEKLEKVQKDIYDCATKSIQLSTPPKTSVFD
jgi:chaperonin cofactor prefoldin